MNDKDFTLLLSSVQEAGDIKQGIKKASRNFEINIPKIKLIRKSLNVSQSEFAMMIGVSVRTLQNWEQGRRRPQGTAKVLLNIVNNNPQVLI